MATVRRWWGFMAVSALLNFAALVLAGYFWPPLPAVPPPPAPKLLLLTLLPPTPRVKPPPRPEAAAEAAHAEASAEGAGDAAAARAAPARQGRPRRIGRRVAQVAPIIHAKGRIQVQQIGGERRRCRCLTVPANVFDRQAGTETLGQGDRAGRRPNNKDKAGQGKSLDTTGHRPSPAMRRETGRRGRDKSGGWRRAGERVGARRLGSVRHHRQGRRGRRAAPHRLCPGHLRQHGHGDEQRSSTGRSASTRPARNWRQASSRAWGTGRRSP